MANPKYRPYIPYRFEADPNFKDTISGYRYSQTGRDINPKTGLETLPISFLNGVDPKTVTLEQRIHIADYIRRNLEALRMARELGYPMPKEAYDPKFIASMLLKEDRPDIGANSYGNDPRAVALDRDLRSRVGADPANVAATVYQHSLRAQEAGGGKGISFARAWNGNGTAKDEKGNVIADGKRYEGYMPKFVAAAENPVNKPLLDYINKYLNGTGYTAPLPKDYVDQLQTMYEARKTKAAKEANQNWNQFRQLQQSVFGIDGLFGVPRAKVPSYAADAVAPPNYDQLRNYYNPMAHYYGGGIASLKKG
jgi:hypothetical protein